MDSWSKWWTHKNDFPFALEAISETTGDIGLDFDFDCGQVGEGRSSIV